MTKRYEIRSGRRTVSMQRSVTPLQALMDYVCIFGSTSNEVQVVGVDSVAWRGARFTAVLVPDEQDAPAAA